MLLATNINAGQQRPDFPQSGVGGLFGWRQILRFLASLPVHHLFSVGLGWKRNRPLGE
jgi:hypothetical protein